MPAPWSKAAAKVLVGVLTREICTTAWAKSLRELYVPNGSIFTIAGAVYDHARNEVCKVALQGGYDYLFFLDDDVCCPGDTIVKLMQDDKDIVSGVYLRRQPPICPVVRVIDKQGIPQWLTQFNWPALIEVDYVGGGCVLIKRKVLEAMAPRNKWFEWRSNRDDLPMLERMSEDFAFCADAKKLFGFKVWLDTAVQCQHVGLGRSSIGKDATGNMGMNFEPLVG